MRETSSGETATVRPPLAGIIDLLRCPVSAQPLVQDGDALVSLDGLFRYPITASGIPLFAKTVRSAEAATQEAHYEKIAEAFDSVFMLDGIHHVNDRPKLIGEVARILKPGGAFYFREPENDFFLWRWLRSVIYRLSPALDHETERPLTYQETVPVLAAAGLNCSTWKTHGFAGFCLFMNSDVLVFNRLFRFIPGIRLITRASIVLDRWIVSLPPLRHAGLQVIGVAVKPKDSLE